MNNIMFVARIHNNKLGTCVPVDDHQEGEQLIREWVKDQFGRDLSKMENDVLVNDGEFYNDDDPDNIVTFSIGMM